MNKAVLCFMLVLSSAAFAQTGIFFNIAESGADLVANINLCLNGYGPLTCQNFVVHHDTLSIATTPSGKTYSIAGIKVNTPGFTLTLDSGCTPISNGYCLFSVSDMSPAIIFINDLTPQPDPGTATLAVSGSPLDLTVNESGTLTITNTSSSVTANDISSTFDNTSLEGNITETGNTCQALAPGTSCTLTFTASSTAVAPTIFNIQGNNTQAITATISIEPLEVAGIIALHRHLELLTSGAAGSITVINISNSVTATDIVSDFTGTALFNQVTETGNTCTQVAPHATCTLTFTPGPNSVAETIFPIHGTNTNLVNGFISITPPPIAEIQVSNSPLTLNTHGQSGSLTITNLSSIVTATNIISSFAGTPLDGNVTETGNTCSSLLPGASCTLSYTPGSSAVALSSFTIQGTNTPIITAELQIMALSIGSNFGGGKIACLTSEGGFSNLIAAISDEKSNPVWAPTPLAFLGATSISNGLANTNTIVNAIGTSTAYAAGRCMGYEVDSLGNSPCEPDNTCYNDWYLPAVNELICLFQNENAIGGFKNNGEYWTSTEHDSDKANTISFSDGSLVLDFKTNKSINLRCVRSFIP